MLSSGKKNSLAKIDLCHFDTMLSKYILYLYYMSTNWGDNYNE